MLLLLLLLLLLLALHGKAMHADSRQSVCKWPAYGCKAASVLLLHGDSCWWQHGVSQMSAVKLCTCLHL